MHRNRTTRFAAAGAAALGALAASGGASGQGYYPQDMHSAYPAPGMVGGDSEGGIIPLFRTGPADCSGRPDKGERSPFSQHARVVATFPAEGAVVKPGLVVVRVTFDQPMACDASFYGTSDLPNPCPGRWARQVTLSKDRRSFRTVCEVKANIRYRLTLRSFYNTHGLTVPAAVTFSTSGAAPIATIRQALAEDVGGDAVAGG
jgi:hypothetical protein